MNTEIVIHTDKIFQQVDYSDKALRNREFIRCHFIGCDFSKSDLRTNDFEDCKFETCNLSMVNLQGVGLRNIIFKDCKIMGVDFSSLNKFMFSFSFDNCQLDYSIFYGANLKKMRFLKCSLHEVDFSEADLSASVFADCDLLGATFVGTNVEKVDFRTSTNVILDLDLNKVKKAKFMIYQLELLLLKYDLAIENDLN
ncbi:MULTISPECIES: pentapeptide repeat-containing protein [Sphingobacterium]|uniref:pentapeptide repeat-containing protein n=1 Tax=Sphingobacterium TaxID=28453 RepID=UPI0013D9B028|nr:MULTISPECIES: pentapeptide repeat-containing protein [unclassified Sphingobacterium]